MEIEFDNVSLLANRKTYAEKLLLDEVSFKLSSGGKYAFLGNSGAGKTADKILLKQ